MTIRVAPVSVESSETVTMSSSAVRQWVLDEEHGWNLGWPLAEGMKTNVTDNQPEPDDSTRFSGRSLSGTDPQNLHRRIPNNILDEYNQAPQLDTLELTSGQSN